MAISGKVGPLAGKISVFEGFMLMEKLHRAMITNFVCGSERSLLDFCWFC